VQEKPIKYALISDSHGNLRPPPGLGARPPVPRERDTR
jgi:hypothetical protein